MFPIPDKNNMYFDANSHLYIEIRDTLSIIGIADIHIKNNSKPAYCGLLMNRQQIQQIIDNSHLFDSGLVNSAHIVANIFDTQIKFESD